LQGLRDHYLAFEVRLDPNMVENFKRQVMIAQTLQPK